MVRSMIQLAFLTADQKLHPRLLKGVRDSGSNMVFIQPNNEHLRQGVAAILSVWSMAWHLGQVPVSKLFNILSDFSSLNNCLTTQTEN